MTGKTGIIINTFENQANLKNNFQRDENQIYPQTNLIWNSNPKLVNKSSIFQKQA